MQVAGLQLSAVRRQSLIGRRNFTSEFRLDESQGHIYECSNAHTFLLNQGHHACLHSEFNFVFK